MGWTEAQGAVDGKTKVCGLIGDPVAHSLSPLLHNSAYRALSINYTYLPFHVEPADLSGAIKGAQALGICGLNVTTPHKETVIPLLDQIHPGAATCGSVNTICFQRGAAVGYSTDGEGILWALQREGGWSPGIGRKVVMLGAGGAAKSAAFALAGAGTSELVIMNRTYERAAELAAALKKAYPQGNFWAEQLSSANLPRHLTELTLMINSLSAEPYDWQSIDASFPSGAVACDMRYSPHVTPFLQWAAARGALAFNGRGMLAGQAALSFQLFTGRDAPFELMYSLIKA